MLRQAVILVGGRGTRLGGLTQDVPKPLLPVMGRRTFLDVLIGEIARHGLSEILLLAGHMGDQVEARFDGRTICGAKIKVIREREPAGTGGALKLAQAHLDNVFLMTNGDSLLDMNYLALAHALGPDDLGALALRHVPDGRRFGRVEASGPRITGFREKDPSFASDALISGGVYVLRKALLDDMPPAPCSLETDVFPVLAAHGKLAAHRVDGFFIDIGLPETLEEARSELPAALTRGAAFFDRDDTLNEDEGYTHRPEDLVWKPGAIEAIRTCNDAGRFVFVVTNQSGIARGKFSADDMAKFHARMKVELAAYGAHVDRFYFSPFHVDGTVEHLALDNHPDRKPNAGMLRRAFLEWPVDPARSFMIGDRDDDVGAAKAAGIPGFKVASGEILPCVKRALGQPAKPAMSNGMTQDLKRRATEAKAWLFDHALPLWWSHGFDRATGLWFERLNADASPARLPRRVRVQARQTYVYALAGELGWTGPWREAVDAGARALLEHCLRPDGGVRHVLDEDGKPKDDRPDLYDTAFVIFGLAHAGRIAKRPELIAKAEEIVAWVEKHWTHPQGGFREGDVDPQPPRRQNPHMHSFEAFLALHQATGKPEHLARASRIGELFGTKLFDRKHGALPEYFDDTWVPMAGEQGRICEPGHQLEWSWLLNRWRDAGGGDLTAEAEQMRLHAEVYGIANGFAIDETYLDGMPRLRTSRFWPHTERIKANVIRFEQTQDAKAAANACEAYDALMAYTKGMKPGLWLDRRQADGSFVQEPSPASTFYHAILALSELIRVAG